ncbi:hypothetical protein H5410_052573 [Solanum commersonii]|uniref:Uncharacterized protein n=1 Tax=Solanum commersonii TaxID=4109 RepID=A0A9J5X1V3_SOLCO|nr:hypothetical protein H5410_052573 [Solanum commersonii]
MKILTARLASEDRFWSRMTLRSLPEALDDICGIWFKRYWWGSVRRPFGGEKILHRESSTRDRLRRLWFSLVRLSMFRHLFIDLLEYGVVWGVEHAKFL